MTPVHYKARVLPDGHLPLPENCGVKTGDEVEVTLAPPVAGSDEEKGARQRDYGRKHWAGAFQSGLTDVAEHHDDYLYGAPKEQ